MLPLLLAALALAADPKIIARTNAPSPADPKITLTALGDAVINASGQVAFWGVERVPPHEKTTKSTSVLAVWAPDGNGGFQVLGERTLREPLSGVLEVAALTINSRGEVAFSRHMMTTPAKVAPTDSEEVWGPGKNGYEALFSAGDPIPGADPGTYASLLSSPRIDDHGVTSVYAFAKRTKNGANEQGYWGHAIIASSGGASETTAFASVSSPFQELYTNFSPNLFVDSESRLIVAAMTSSHQSTLLRTGPDGKLAPVVTEGTGCPGKGSPALHYGKIFSFPTPGPKGTLGFLSSVVPPEAPNNSCTAAWLSKADGSIFRLDPGPAGATGLDVYGSDRVVAIEIVNVAPMDDHSALVVGAGHFTREPRRFGDKVRPSVYFIWLCREDKPANLLFRSGQKLDGPLAGLEIASLNANASPGGTAAAINMVASPDCRNPIVIPGDRQSLWAWTEQAGPHMVLLQGQTLGKGEDALTIHRISVPMFQGIADDGTIVATVTSKEGRVAVVTAK